MLTSVFLTGLPATHDIYSSRNDSQISTNQTAAPIQSSTQNLTELIEEKFTKAQTSINGTEVPPIALVEVISESPKTVVLFGELITPARYANAELWQAVDLLKNDYGFTLTHVIHDGQGSVFNPGRVYLVMEHS